MLPNSDPATLQRETPSSVEITRNSKGEIQFSIKVYAAVGEEDDAAFHAIEIFERLTNWAKEMQP